MMRFLVPAVAILIAACATNPGSAVPEGRQREIIFDDKVGTVRTDANPPGTAVAIALSPDQTWEAIKATYAEIGVEVKYLNRPVGELGNRDVTLSRRLGTEQISRYLDCGTDPFAGSQANAYPVRASLVTKMRAEGAGTMIETKLSGSMTKPGAGATVYCNSTGALELLIAVAVAKRSTE